MIKKLNNKKTRSYNNEIIYWENYIIQILYNKKTIYEKTK